MKQYTADKHAQYTLQIAAPVVSAVLIGLIWYFLAVLPHWMLWTLTVIVAAAAVLLSTLLLPMWFCTIVYSVSATHITRKCGIFFVQEQTMRTQALQFSSIFRAPFSEKNGMNFIPLHAYGGTVILAFLSRSDAEEIQAFLQKTVYSHSQRVVEQPVLPEEGPDFDVFESAMQETKAPPADDTERSEP